MKKKKIDKIIQKEIFKYPYNGSIEENEKLSEHLCLSTLKDRKKLVNTLKWWLVYGQFTITIASGIFPSQSIGIPIYSRPSLINLSNNLNKNFHNDKKFKIMEFINNKVDKKNFTEQEISELQQLVYSEFREGKTVEQVIDELRGGGILDDDAYLLGVLLGVTFILFYTISPTQALKPILNYRNLVDFSNFSGPLHPHMKGYRSAARFKCLILLAVLDI